MKKLLATFAMALLAFLSVYNFSISENKNRALSRLSFSNSMAFADDLAKYKKYDINSHIDNEWYDPDAKVYCKETFDQHRVECDPGGNKTCTEATDLPTNYYKQCVPYNAE